MAQAGQESTTCPVKRLAAEQAGLQHAYRVLEEIEVKESDRFNNPIWREMLVIERRIDAIEEAASWERAKSLDGAVFQLLLVGRDLQLLSDCTWPADELDGHAEKMRRYLYSALDALGCDFKSEMADVYFPARLDALAKMARIVEAMH